jgi:hypothetical protein
MLLNEIATYAKTRNEEINNANTIKKLLNLTETEWE